MTNDTISNVEPLFDDLSSLNLPDVPESLRDQEKAEISDGEKFVVFFLDDEFFAVLAREVAEIVRPLDFTPLPNSPAWLYGIANLRGEIVSVLNLSKICRKTAVSDSAKSKLIVLKSQHSAAPVAFPVDRLSEIIALRPADIQPAEDVRFFGRAVYKTASVRLLDTEKLFSTLSLS
jgi:purine-binding chemotaxis protein CheW